MWAVTGWAVATWLKITVFLALGVGAAWLWCTPGWFAVVVIAAGLVELWAIRQLCREWAYEGAFVVVVVPVTADGPGAGQLDLFGHPTTPPVIPGQRPPSRIESNDVDLMVTVAANAVRCGYLLVGTAERVYARADTNDHVARVPRYEEDAVHQLLRRRWLTLGATHRVTCGAAHLTGTAVLVPKATRDRIARWERLQRPPSRPTDHRPPRDAADGHLVNLDDYRRTR